MEHRDETATEELASTPPPLAPAGAQEYLGDQFALMTRYVEHLATTAISHGLIGPRERDALWTRHVLNCAVLSELLAPDSSVIDVGSGAGLPGLVLAIARPDLEMTLVEPLLRRSTWLTDVVTVLELPNVTVRRDRAEAVVDLQADVVTSRAVARLDKLTGWCAPLARPGGRIVAIKGNSADQELTEVGPALTALGVREARIVHCGAGVVDPITTAIELTLDLTQRPTRSTRRKKKR